MLELQILSFLLQPFPLGSQYTLSYLHQLLKMDEPLLEYLASKDLAALMDVLWCVLDGKG